MEPWPQIRYIGFMSEFLIALGISVVLNSVFFGIAAALKTDVVTDLSYGLSFALAAIALALVGAARDPVRLAAAAMVVVWAARLAGYLFTRILKTKVDHRFDGRREDPVEFAKFWALQALSVTVIMLPAIAVLARPAPAASPLHVVGAAVWLAGLVIESVADAQKSAWKRRGEPGFIDRGLWAWSRHPNYFGEILVWWGLWLFALPSLAGAWHLAVLGPICITSLLLFVTGIPPLEKSARKRYENDGRYADYASRTSILVPLPPRRTAR
jgi:steroid 5-alpha reductase family enzyme